jgi:hypothetical protein
VDVQEGAIMNEALRKVKEALEKISKFDEYEPAGPAARTAKEALPAISKLADVCTYAIKLEQIIESICNGTKLPANIPDFTHYKMAEKYLASQKQVAPVAAQEVVKSHDEIRTALYLAAISCWHSIESESVVLMRDDRKPGNALAQLADRLLAAYLALPHAIADRIDAANQGESGKDAEQYQWLLQRFVGYDFEWGEPPMVCAVFEVGNDFKGGRDIDASIRAALAHKGGGK